MKKLLIVEIALYNQSYKRIILHNHYNISLD